MNILSYSEARASFKETMDVACRDHNPTVVTRRGGDPVVILSLADYSSMEETLYLLSSEKNAARLRASIAEIKAGKAQIRELISVSEVKAKQQSEYTQ